MQASKNNSLFAVNIPNQIRVPSEIISSYHLQAGAHPYIQDSPAGFFIASPTRLAKLYIEPTNQCNLGCRTCIRNTWNEPMGKMSTETFQAIIKGLRSFSIPPKVFFGGFGEPLMHPELINMIEQVKILGASVELITNGTLLTPELSKEMIRVGPDVIWVSIDGACPESYNDIRSGAALPQVLNNLQRFHTLLYESLGEGIIVPRPEFNTELGIVFVAMKRNIADLPAVISIGRKFEVKRFLVTNVLPYTEEMREEILYERALDKQGTLDLPLMDQNDIVSKPLSQLDASGLQINWNGLNTGIIRGQCPFIEKGAAAISWDGGFSPCLPLMHSHTSYYHNRTRFSRRWIVGSLMEMGLNDLWNDVEHLAFRERVQRFDFAPCTTCYSCHLFENNEEDCSGNVFPTCGGCLWAQGLIRCP